MSGEDNYEKKSFKVLKKLPIRVIDFNDKDDKKLHDNIASIQKSLIELQHQIDLSAGNKREVTPLKRQFINGKAKLEKALKDLYGLGNDDDLIPLISELYNAAN